MDVSFRKDSMLKLVVIRLYVTSTKSFTLRQASYLFDQIRVSCSAQRIDVIYDRYLEGEEQNLLFLLNMLI